MHMNQHAFRLYNKPRITLSSVLDLQYSYPTLFCDVCPLFLFCFFFVAHRRGEQKGKHAFKFIVDDEWRFAPDQPTVADIEGRVNNFIDVSDFVGYTGEENFEANRMKVGLLSCMQPSL